MAGRTRPGDLLMHPIAVLAVVVLVVSDRVLKPVAPGLLTGKLSRHLSYDVDTKDCDVKSIALSPEIHPVHIIGSASRD
jgi:hypothetical protein